MKRIITYGILLITFLLLQTTVFSYMSLGGIVPNLFIILTAFAGITQGRSEGCVVGFFAGLLLDCAYGSLYFGSYALAFVLIGYGCGIFNRIFYEDDITLPILIIGLADFAYGLVVYVTGFLSRGRTHFFFYFRKIILPEMIYTIFIGIFIYRLLLYLYKRLENKGSEDTIV